MAAATAARSRSATEVWLLGQPERTPVGETASQERASATALLPLRPCAAEVGVKEAASLVTAEVAVVWERKHGSHAEEEPLCGEDPPAVRIMAELGSLTSRIAGVLTGADDAFRHGARGRLRPHHGGRGSAVPAGPALPGWTRCIMQGVDQSLADRERRRLERGVLKRSSSPERATTATRSSSGLGAGDEEEKRW
ncbi:hypothetical protein GWK47_037415 [Chionoecetes opilio]|uniref:Uncharacterized protein n=1 Tax=Chionoecetes opilio TaxID=41210 RepID=A0A8J5CZA3_CHIOP|nr:hypothetical protein GWK47_037415 [Chionoecetes opilio]